MDTTPTGHRAAALLLAACASLLAGCASSLATFHEARLYREEQAADTRAALAACRQGQASPHDHRGAGSESADCYLAMVEPTTRLATGSGLPGQRRRDPWWQSTPTVLTASELGQLSSAQELVSQVAWMAVLSNLAYHRFADVRERSDKPSACRHALQEWDPLERLNRAEAESRPQGSVPRRHWQRWKQDGAGCTASDGLFYETYVYVDEAAPPEQKILMAVIAFRGTENSSDQLTEDWWSNVAGAFGAHAPQYDLVTTRLPGLLDDLLGKGDERRHFPVYATGHSLGGGLAQHAAYMNRDITAAYVFNTSPATGWTALRAAYRAPQPGKPIMQVQDPQVIRVTQDGEWLSLVRLVSNAANSAVRRSNRTNIYLDFPSTRQATGTTGRFGVVYEATELHSIALMSCNLAARVARSGETAAFGFTPAMARRMLAEDRDDFVEHRGDNKADTTGLCQYQRKDKDSGGKLNCRIDWISGAVEDCGTDAGLTPRSSP
ncbi:DUF6792 domain-containing protein [Pelomonas sp. KK5]|uniref:DUF6792 domain-containing protein n=1 Tax=Pelomonas sp. KK5 TaxID=1855730 RepID=UPI00097BDF78|nr:DUF6792 domain-containing protein [Pelomonas sp. KK5]